MPEGTPLQALPHDELLKRFRQLTNVHVVSDKDSSTGYRVEVAPFPGWRQIPSFWNASALRTMVSAPKSVPVQREERR
jgi:hypothetical protein